MEEEEEEVDALAQQTKGPEHLLERMRRWVGVRAEEGRVTNAMLRTMLDSSWTACDRDRAIWQGLQWKCRRG